MAQHMRVLVLSFWLLAGAVLSLASPSPQVDDDGNRVDDDASGGGSEGRVPRLGLGGSLFAEVARELMSRSTTNSQVLSLNLTNLFILVVLKAILFGAGMFSFSFLNKGHGYGGTGFSAGSIGRSNEDPVSSALRPNSFVSESEVLLALSYLMGDAKEKYGCLQRVACEDPGKAREYLGSAKLLVKGVQLFNKDIPEKYSRVLSQVQEAVDLGSNGGRCDAQFKCSSSR